MNYMNFKVLEMQTQTPLTLHWVSAYVVCSHVSST